MSFEAGQWFLAEGGGQSAGGDDWTVKRPDGVVELDLRITLVTDDGGVSTGKILAGRPVHVIEDLL